MQGSNQELGNFKLLWITTNPKVFRSSIPRATEIQAPLNDFLKVKYKHNHLLYWCHNQVNAFNNLRKAIANADLLVQTSTPAPMIDASNTLVGSVIQ